MKLITLLAFPLSTASTFAALPYAIVDTGQDRFFDNSTEIAQPMEGEAFYGQDAEYQTNPFDYVISEDELTVYDAVTELTWTRSHDWNNDGLLNATDKMTQAEAEAYAAELNAVAYGGYTDWRLPSIKEIYSLMDFRGKDPNVIFLGEAGLVPFINENYFLVGIGDDSAGERLIDSQFATTSIYVDEVSSFRGVTQAMFGLNFVDGRIKGYELYGKTYYARYCRGNQDYGKNVFMDNGDGTVTDLATGLMWTRDDSGTGMDWETALAYAESSMAAGYSDWRLPNAKELQSLVDYTRSPETTQSAAIDPIFNATEITNLAGESDYPWYWSSTTHEKFDGDAGYGTYICFGRGLGAFSGGDVVDVHGAGCQRSDPKTGNPDDYPIIGDGPQGDVIRVFNHARLVRTVDYPSWVFDTEFGRAGGGYGWLWTSAATYPWFYRYDDGTWLWRYLRSEDGFRAYYNYATGTWEW